MSFTDSLEVLLIDGKPHPLTELLPYLKRRINPSRAARVFARKNNGRRHKLETLPPLKEQIERGVKTILQETLTHLLAKEIITITPPGRMVDLNILTLQLTPLAMEKLHQRRKPQRGARIWKELRKALAQGWLNIQITINPSVLDEEPNEEIIHGA